MQLYGNFASHYVARVALYAQLQGLTLRPEMPPEGIKSAGYLALNPMGKMPLLVDDDVAIAESEVICAYLEDLRPGLALPGTPATRARARTLSRVFDVYAAPAANVLFRAMGPGTRDDAAIAAAMQDLGNAFGDLEHFLAAPYAAGEQPSLADCTLLPAFAILKQTAFPMFTVPDPTLGAGKLGRWWSFVTADVRLGAFLREYDAAVAAFLRSLG